MGFERGGMERLTNLPVWPRPCQCVGAAILGAGPGILLARYLHGSGLPHPVRAEVRLQDAGYAPPGACRTLGPASAPGAFAGSDLLPVPRGTGIDAPIGRARSVACYLERMDNPSRIDPEALRIFIAQRERFLSFLRRHVRNESEAEDLLQQGLLKAIRHQADWDGKESILSWFFRILRNALTDHYRSSAAERRRRDSLQAEAEPPMTPEDREQLCSCFKEVLPSLKPEYAEVLRRVDLEEEEPAEVAASLGVTPNNLSVRLHRARQSLRTNLEKTCGVCTRHGCLDCTCGRSGHTAQ